MAHTARGGLGAAAGVAAVGFIAGMAATKVRKLAVQGMEATQGDWFDVLKAEHRAVEKIFDQIFATKEDEKMKRTKLLLALEQALGKHALQEEDVVYPHLRMAGIEAETKELASEHADIKTYLAELEELPKDDPHWIQRVKEFRKLIDHHVQEEETEIFPRYRDQLSPEESAKLTARMHMEGLKLA